MNFLGVRRSATILSCQMHEHPNWELIYQQDAPTTAVTAMGSFHVEPGELIVIPPNTPHRTVSDTPFRDFCVKLAYIDIARSPTVGRDVDGSILRIYDLLFCVQDERSEMGLLLQEKLAEALSIAVKKANAELHEPVAVASFRHHLRENVENLCFDLTGSIRARGYHPDYFRRYFKRHTGVSPLVYLNQLRIERAKELLRLESSLSVGEIALRCGFRDPLYFSTAFKRSVGKAPLAYRKENFSRA